MIPNKCVVRAQESESCCEGFEPAVMLLDLVSHVVTMSALLIRLHSGVYWMRLGRFKVDRSRSRIRSHAELRLTVY